MFFELDPLFAVLAGAREVRNRMWKVDPAPGSMGESDISVITRELGSETPGVRLYELANFWLLLAAEHLRGVGVLIKEGKSWPSMFPLMRSSIELCGGAVWLINQGSTPVERGARAAVAVLDGAERRIEVEGKFAKGSKAFQAAKQHRNELVALLRTEFGSDEVTVSPCIVRGVPTPTPTTFVASLAERGPDLRTWEGIYALLCGLGVHPTTSFSGHLGQVEPLRAELSISDEQLLRYLKALLHPFLLAFGAVASSMGWERSDFDQYHARVIEVLDAMSPSGHSS